MRKSLHFHFYNIGAQLGSSQRYIMCNFYAVRDGEVQSGDSQIVKEQEWPVFREYLERGGWKYRAPHAINRTH